jgi:hypothetical protein
MLLAMLKLARADYGVYARFKAYAQLSTAKDLYVEAAGELGLILGSYTATMAAHSDLEAARRSNNVASMLLAPASGESGLQRQMEHLAGSEEERGRLPTVAQLQHSCCNCMVLFAFMARQERQEQQPTEDQLARLTMTAVASGVAMRQLEPNDPKSHIGQALALNLGGGSQRQIAESCLRAFELAQQQGSDYFICTGASTALMAAAQHPPEVGHATLEAALAAFEGPAEAALRSCRRLLPADWVQHLERQVEQARTLVPEAREQLRLVQQQASGVAVASEALEACIAAQAAANNAHQEATGGDSRQILHATACDGCGQRAVGLRRCGRCMRAQYRRWVRGRLSAAAFQSLAGSGVAANGVAAVVGSGFGRYAC